MNIKSFFFCMGLLIPLCQENYGFCGHLDYSNKDIIDVESTSNDRVAIPVRKFIREILTKDEDELENTNSLNLSKNTIQGPGFDIIIGELIPKLPNLKILDVSYNLIGEKGLDPLYKLLESNNSLEYISISGNGIARLISKEVQKMEEECLLKQKIAEKVVFTPKSMINETFSSSSPFLEKWKKTHEEFYSIDQ